MKMTVIAMSVAVLIIGGTLLWIENSIPEEGFVQNVNIINDVQIIEIRAKGGYIPRKSFAKAGIPTILRFITNGTFDCSSFVRIPSMRITQTLSRTGNTDINLGVPQIATLQGTCGMGMYPFEIIFQS